MIPIPRIVFEVYVNVWGKKAAELFFHPAPVGFY